MKNFIELKSHCVRGVDYIIENKNYNHIEEFFCPMKDIRVNHGGRELRGI